MRVPLSWLCDFAPFGDDSAALATELDDLGLVVEGVQRVGEGLADVVVARVEEIGPIAGADRIRRVVVEAGSGPVEVVCGAWNFHEGDLVPLAPVGAVLPGGFEIGRRTMKGVVSNGMLCSPSELDLAGEHQGILVLGSAVLDGTDALEPGTALIEALGLEPDVVFDLSVDANRPDAWSVAGVARDLAARLRLPFTLPDPPTAPSGPEPVERWAHVEVVDDDLCPRFTARVLRGVAVGPSPRWLVRRLTLAGMRSINNVVDASNYVMLELGQPTHLYDLDRVAGGGLRVRAARRGESVITLDGTEHHMGERALSIDDDRRDCLICDAEDTPVGIAGIMGGASSEITAATTRVLVEVAYFTPMAIARTAKRLSLRTEASARFERGCDPWGIDRAAARLSQVLSDGAGGVFEAAAGAIDVCGPVPGPGKVTVRTARVNAVLGTDLDAVAVAGYLEPIGFQCETAPGVLQVTVPTFRPDTAREIDVIEEVARHYGYSRIPRRKPAAPQVGALTSYQRQRRLVREVVAGLGAHEAWTTSLLAPGDHALAGMHGGVEVANPLTPDESVLRQGLLPGLLRAIAFNADRRQGEIRLFEIGRVFPPPDPARLGRALARTGDWVIDERELLALALAGPGDDALTAAAAWSVLRDALSLQGIEPQAVGDDVEEAEGSLAG
ncbi:MAG: phenylalanine--tRNA ligase subunit beta, partial [Acidimicrobiales bacterium]